jgi:methyl-galactoside transport system substrate-binding protein
VANWDTSQAQDKMQALLSANEGKIEAVFCNNDDMALGVIAALNADGYNNGGPSDGKWIPVVGVDATDAGMEAINQGKEAATVKQDGDAMGKCVIAVAINAGLGKSDWLEGTDYKLDTDGVSIRIPYSAISSPVLESTGTTAG